jgi:hypothetical protein
MNPFNQPLQTARTSNEELRPATLKTSMPLGVIQVQTTATTIYTAVTYDFSVQHLVASNVTAGALTYTVYAVPEGGTAGVGNMVVPARTLAGYGSEIIAPMVNYRIAPGGFIQAICSANDGINISGWGFDEAGNYGG